LGVSDLGSLGISINFAIGMILIFIIILASFALWLLNTGKGIRT
jgi:hypothetical protein